MLILTDTVLVEHTQIPVRLRGTLWTADFSDTMTVLKVSLPVELAQAPACPARLTEHSSFNRLMVLLTQLKEKTLGRCLH